MVKMARSLRVEYAGAYYRVMERENRSARRYLSRALFLKAVSEVCAQTGGETEDAERRVGGSNLEKNGMEKPLQEAAENAR
jgi:hypothetical protein